MKRFSWFLLVALAVGCGRKSAEPHFQPREPAPPKPAVSEKAPAEDAGSVQTSEDAGPNPTAWSHFAREDDVPFCIFSRYADWGDVQYLKDAKPKASLKAGQEVHFGVYAPRCAHPDCTRLVNMQCWADVAGTTITLHSRYNGLQNSENTCSKDCEPDTAACYTPALQAGTYTIEYGAYKQTLRIPSVVKPTCVDPLAR